MMKVAALVGGVWLMASAAQAQIVIDVSAAAPPNGGEIITCMTRMCRTAIADVREFTPDHSSNPADIATCSAANQALGRWIAQVGRNITSRYDRGEMNYDLAADARSLIYSETFTLRDTLRRAVRTGDVRRCEQLKDRAIIVVNQILRSAVGYNGPSRSEGFAYGSSR